MSDGPARLDSPIELGPPLECGCRRGHTLCEQARTLWSAVGVAYDRRDFAGYDRALIEYNDHFGVRP